MQALGCWGDDFICICGFGILRGGTITHFIRNDAVQIRTLCLEAVVYSVDERNITLVSALCGTVCHNVATAYVDAYNS